MTDTERFFERLLYAAPILRQIHKEHVEDHDSIIPHVLLGEITMWMIRAAKHPANRPVLQQIMVLVDDAASSDDEYLSNLAAVSCIDCLCGETQALAVLTPMMGEAGRRQLDAFCDS
jgi:hypothetical protein